MHILYILKEQLVFHSWIASSLKSRENLGTFDDSLQNWQKADIYWINGTNIGKKAANGAAFSRLDHVRCKLQTNGLKLLQRLLV